MHFSLSLAISLLPCAIIHIYFNIYFSIFHGYCQYFYVYYNKSFCFYRGIFAIYYHPQNIHDPYPPQSSPFKNIFYVVSPQITLNILLIFLSIPHKESIQLYLPIIPTLRIVTMKPHNIPIPFRALHLKLLTFLKFCSIRASTTTAYGNFIYGSFHIAFG